MSLTPADVHNVTFEKASLGKRGYDMEQVDTFLDKVEKELERLISENNDLRQKLEHAQQTSEATDGDLAATVASLEAALQQEQQARQEMEQTARQLAAELEIARANVGVPNGGEHQALQILTMAQKTADEYVAQARQEADELVTRARAEAEAITKEATARAAEIETEVHARYRETLGGLDSKRAELEQEIAKLQHIERTYRATLRGFLENQLAQLDAGQQPNVFVSTEDTPQATSAPHTINGEAAGHPHRTDAELLGVGGTGDGENSA